MSDEQTAPDFRALRIQLQMAADTHARLKAQLNNNKEMLRIIAQSAHEQGMTYESIAKGLGVAKRTVWLWLNPED